MEKNKNVGSFTAIDFETANSHSYSACQLGIVVVRDGEVTEERSWLIRPPTPLFTFTDIHGITYQMVRDEPTFREIWREVYPYIIDQTVAAHNARFDENVLLGTLHYYRLAVPAFSIIDSLAVARAVWPDLPNHQLHTVAAHLNIALQHHDAASDARACAEIIKQADWNSLNIRRARSL